MPAERNISIYTGDTYTHELRLKDSSNVAINITSRTYSGTLKTSRTSSDTIATFVAEITNAANGIVLFSLTASTTANISAGTYVYDFQETNGSVITTLLTGKALIQESV